MEKTVWRTCFPILPLLIHSQFHVIISQTTKVNVYTMIYLKQELYSIRGVYMSRQLEWKVVEVLDMLGLRGVWKKEITTI